MSRSRPSRASSPKGDSSVSTSTTRGVRWTFNPSSTPLFGKATGETRPPTLGTTRPGTKSNGFRCTGPKALTIRSFLDPALESRGFIISASPVEGEEAYGFIVRNLWSDVGDLPARLARWAREASAGWPDSRLREVAESTGLAEKRRRVLEATGANRDTEQVLVALLVAEIAEVEVATELRSAVELRRASVGTQDAGDLEDVTEAILAATGSAQERLIEESPVLRVWFRELKKEVNRRRDERKEPHMSDRRLATMLTQVGVSESWKGATGNRVRFDLPGEFVRRLRDPIPTSPTSPTSSDIDGGGRGGRQGSRTLPETVSDAGPRPATESQVRGAARAAFEQAAREEAERS